MESAVFEGLNEAQREAVAHGDTPLLIIAGAGTGKTRTLVHRVAGLIERGTDPSRILLLTFTRRAAAEMLHRLDGLQRQLAEHGEAGKRQQHAAGKRLWGGTFHATASRLLRIYGKAAGLDEGFTIHDQGDSQDLLDVVRTELQLAKTDKRFPKKGTCLAIYSRSVNSRQPLADLLAAAYPWCTEFADDLKRLFRAYVDRKEAAGVLDYDDLLLFWHGLLSDPKVAEQIRGRFDCVLVDEYQDTNRLQSEILALLRPGGAGLTVVGDDAQSIYSFRAATVRNILDFPQEFPGTTVVKLEQNYRSTRPILEATNAVIAGAGERFTKSLWSTADGGRPRLVICEDEDEQSTYLVRQILEHREGGIDLRQQAVLFRASHHSILLEAELAQRNIPFVKYGGLKFIEAAHVKDLLSFLRLAENPRDVVAGLRLLKLLPGIGPKKAQQLLERLLASKGDFRAWSDVKVPTEATELWSRLVQLMVRLTGPGAGELAAQVHAVRQFYAPILAEQYDHVEPRRRDLEQLEQVAARFTDRQAMLADLTLDPPNSTEDFAGPPHLDEDYLILSTIHSAKGLEWEAVYVIHASDGNIPSDMATRDAQQIDEERRLFYVALTRAKRFLYVTHPHRYYHAAFGSFSDRHSYAQRTRFIDDDVKASFDCLSASTGEPPDEQAPGDATTIRTSIRDRSKSIWS